MVRTQVLVKYYYRNKKVGLIFFMFICNTATLYFPMIPFDPLKTSENLWFSDVFKGIKKEPWEEKD